MLLHALELLPETKIFDLGHSGVDIFFVISGFVMVEATRGRHMTSLDFLRRRVIRIVPLYWLLTLVLFAVAAVAPSLLKSTNADPIALAKSLAFIPYMKGSGLTEPVLFVGWTLNYEMFFYLLFAGGLAVGGVRGVVSALVGLCLMRPFATGPVGLFYTDPIILEFGYGMCVAALYARLSPRRTVSAGILAAGVVALLVSGQIEAHRALAYGVPAAAIVLGAVWLEKAGIACRNKAALALGDASYALYLSHPFVAQLALNLGAGWSLPARGALLILAFGVMIGVAVALHAMIERPVLRLAKPKPVPMVAMEPAP